MHLKVTGHIPPWRMAVHEEVVKRAWLHHAVLTCKEGPTWGSLTQPCFMACNAADLALPAASLATPAI